MQFLYVDYKVFQSQYTLPIDLFESFWYISCLN